MNKTALLFAGQGAQVIGMGKDMAEKFPSARAWFDRANAALGYDLASVCFHGPEAELTKTENAQPGIFLVHVRPATIKVGCGIFKDAGLDFAPGR